jgi:hypothetical protein
MTGSRRGPPTRRRRRGGRGPHVNAIIASRGGWAGTPRKEPVGPGVGHTRHRRLEALGWVCRFVQHPPCELEVAVGGEPDGPSVSETAIQRGVGRIGWGRTRSFFFFDVGRVACGATASAEACRKGHANAVSVTASSFPPFRFRDMQIFSWWARIMRSQTL